MFSLAGISSAAYPTVVEPRWLDVDHRRVKLQRAGLVQPIRVLHMSDLHASMFVSLKMITHAVELGLAERPDIVCVTGDFISHRHDIPGTTEYARVLRKLSAAAPTFAVLGNHDGGRWAVRARGWANHLAVERIMEQSGIELLHNRSRVVEVHGQKLALVGTGDYWAEETEPETAFRGIDPRLPAILLAHNPDTKELCSQHCWDLMLSGHTHGGQIIVPFYGTPFRAVEDINYLEGLKAWGSRQIHVTRGVGNLLGVRFNCRPEVNLLHVG